MKLMRCPLNGWRGVAEFMYGGVVEDIPDPDACDDRARCRVDCVRCCANDGRGRGRRG
jgi:hypothetical protein